MWNRLVQVNRDSNPANTTRELGAVAKHYTYDGVGRLVRVQSPWPVGESEVRSERLFYDGVRRIQELVTDPLEETSLAAAGGEPEAQSALAAEPNLSAGSTVARSEANQLAGGPGTGGTGLPPGMTLAREYIWGPGDNGVDELLVQYDDQRVASFPIQDGGGGGDIVAHYDKSALGNARLLWRGTYDAYGRVIESHKALATHAYLHAGHKGLFFDRVDGSIVDPTTLNENPRLVGPNEGGVSAPLGAELLGYARNRTLQPAFGRWLQRDPNATGINVLAAQAFHGATPVASGIQFDLFAHFGDGTNVYGVLTSSPWTNDDPMGLFLGLDLAAVGGARGLLGTMLLGGSLNAAIGSYFGGNLYQDFMVGAVSGGAGGIAYSAVRGFAASASGLFATLMNQAAAGGTAGFVATQTARLGDPRISSADVLWNTALGTLFGPMGSAVERAMFSATLTLRYNPRSLQHCYHWHGADFGYTKNWSKAMGVDFETALRSHAAGAVAIRGSYRGYQNGTHYLDPGTDLWQYFDNGGNFVCGWKLNPKQRQTLLESGFVE